MKSQKSFLTVKIKTQLINWVEYKINYCLYILDNPFNTLTDKTDDECTIRCDKDGTPNPAGECFGPNRELSEANLQFLKEFPKFEEIVTSLRENKFDHDNSNIVSKKGWLILSDKDKLNEVLKNNKN
jgi:hypothetical protein